MSHRSPEVTIFRFGLVAIIGGSALVLILTIVCLGYALTN